MQKTELLQTAIKAALEAGQQIMEVYRSSDAEITFKEDRSPLTLADRRAHHSIMGLLSDTNIPLLSEEGREIPFAERSAWKQLWMVDPLDGTREFISRNGEFTVNIAMIEHGRPTLGVVYAPVLHQLWYGTTGTGAWYVSTGETASVAELMDSSAPLPLPVVERPYRVAGSRSHLNTETESFVTEHLRNRENYEFVSRGSSLKICMIAEGSADIYPRFGPTMEWDTAAGDAIITAAGATLVDALLKKPLAYNKADLLNPFFIATAKKMHLPDHEKGLSL